MNTKPKTVLSYIGITLLTLVILSPLLVITAFSFFGGPISLVFVLIDVIGFHFVSEAITRKTIGKSDLNSKRNHKRMELSFAALLLLAGVATSIFYSIQKSNIYSEIDFSNGTPASLSQAGRTKALDQMKTLSSKNQHLYATIEDSQVFNLKSRVYRHYNQKSLTASHVFIPTKKVFEIRQFQIKNNGIDPCSSSENSCIHTKHGNLGCDKFVIDKICVLQTNDGYTIQIVSALHFGEEPLTNNEVITVAEALTYKKASDMIFVLP